MIDKNQAIKIGIFVFIGIGMFVFSLFVFGGKQLLFRSNIDLHAHFEQVQGLNVGSIVSLAGIKVGNVSDIRFAEDENKLDVVMRVDSDLAKRITKNSIVELRTQGALGDKYVMIIPGDSENPPAVDGEILVVKPEGDLMSVISNRGSEANKIFDILQEIHKFTLAMNKDGRADETFENFKQVSVLLKENLQNSKAAFSEENSKKLASVVNKLDRIASKIDRGEGSLGALINDPALHEQLKALLGGGQKKNAVKSLIRSSIQSSEE